MRGGGCKANELKDKMMTKIVLLLSSGLAGTAAGCIYFAGLWLTTQRMMNSNRPVATYAISFLVRLSLLLLGMGLLIQVGIGYFASAFVGFLFARLLIAAFIGFTNDRPVPTSTEV